MTIKMQMKLIEDIGRGLYGEHWEPSLAIALGVKTQSVKRWATGEHNMKPGHVADIKKLWAERVAEVQGVASIITELDQIIA